ncbi:ABC transporter permease [Nocardioides sp. zg-536]|uniref:ABC transporter permease n=1 Tax=Nocardioides faecalis TaxID=2803858 RepID=A0A938XYH6_9ACTN|nr:ABC transporter permease [Nocardioides faecalis]MBM9458807.1 ABC transporter permease [Nocardioides faecalis]MBS4754100.1 ABC transporter permease [Nocardioides faecalis]QVI60221.1 ABC transporter permease [Nocardioides faecalis]
MLAYAIRRLFIGVILLIVMSLTTFALFFASPIEPADFACGKNCSAAQKKETAAALGYDDNFLEQWGKFAVGVVKGRDFPDDPALRETAPDLIVRCDAPCLGYSTERGSTVTDLVKETLPVTASIAVAAFVLWIFFGVLFGVIAALRRGTIVDRGLVGLSLIVYAFPTFFVGLLLYKFVAVKWGWVDVPRYTSIAEGGIGGWASSLVLPAITLAVFFMAAYVRMTRSYVIESFSEDYVRTARAKGLSERRVTFKHALRAALTPIVTMAGLDFAGLMGGAIITESVFNYPGLGKLAVLANSDFDLPTLVGLVILLATFVIVANIIVDLLYAVIDPRVRLG